MILPIASIRTTTEELGLSCARDQLTLAVPPVGGTVPVAHGAQTMVSVGVRRAIPPLHTHFESTIYPERVSNSRIISHLPGLYPGLVTLAHHSNIRSILSLTSESLNSKLISIAINCRRHHSAERKHGALFSCLKLVAAAFAVDGVYPSIGPISHWFSDFWYIGI